VSQLHGWNHSQEISTRPVLAIETIAEALDADENKELNGATAAGHLLRITANRHAAMAPEADRAPPAQPEM